MYVVYDRLSCKMKHIAFLSPTKISILLYLDMYIVLHIVCVLLYMYIYNVCVCHNPLSTQMARTHIYYNATVKWI